MKKTILLLLLSSFTVISFAQKVMSVRNDSIGLAVSKEADENEGLVIIRSPYELTFKSVTKAKDKEPKPYKIEKEGELNRYYILFSTLSQYSDRVLQVHSKGYNTVQIPIELSAFEVKSYYVWDRKGTVGVSPMDKSINEGDFLFRQCKYDQAKDKYLEALEFIELSQGTQQDQEHIAALLEKTSLCADAKESAENLFNRQEWLSARDKFFEVYELNKNDRECLLRSRTCQERYDNTPRVVTGTVTKNGSPIAGAVVMAVEYNDKGKKKKANESTRTTSDASGKYEIKVLNSTKQFECWEGFSRPKTFEISGNTVNINL